MSRKPNLLWSILFSLCIALVLAACTQRTGEPETTPAVSTEPGGSKHTYMPFSGQLLNPERGFFTPYELPGPAGFSPVRITGNTLVHINFRLDDWREADIPPEALDGLQTNFNDIREAGIKAILRFAYNEGPYPDSEPDASKSQILRHIEQLQPLLQKNGDVIAWVEAGFIGAWGEWHTSTNGLDNLTDKRDILHALLRAMPQNRVAQVRYPANIIEMYPAPADAVAARVGHHNDCFLSSDTDVGTYERDGINTIARDQAYLAELTRYTPMSGETCTPNPPRSECDTAIAEMELLHFSAINEAYHKGILRSWEKGGCMEEITNRLGYRLAMVETTFKEQIRPGGQLDLSVTLENTGFAAPVNPRPLFAVLYPAAVGTGARDADAYKVQLDLDPRAWQPGTSSFSASLHLPSSIPEGQYSLGLWLPDEAANLQGNPLYAIRFANDGTWDEETGYNTLGTVTVNKLAAGSFGAGDTLTVIALATTETIPFAPSMNAPAIVSPPKAEITAPDVQKEGERLAIEFKYSGDTARYNGFQVFFDTDQEPKTGMSIAGAGADMMVENDILYAYAGSGTDWSWTELDTPVIFTNEGQTARWIIPLEAINNPASMDVIFQLVDTNWDTAFMTDKETYNLK